MDGGEFDEDFDFADVADGGWPMNNRPINSIRPLMPPKQRFEMPNNDRYNNAYPNYRGGYGPGGGFGPPVGLRGPRPFGPPPLMPPMPPRGPGPLYGRRIRPGPGGPPPLGGPRPPPPCGPPLPCGPPPGGPSGPGEFTPRQVSPENRALRYLMRCGLLREHVKDLPKQLLLLIEPEYCGVCAMEFDSFIMSRMHYTSRNHQKNQRKWLTQNTEIGSTTKATQIPLKARELYCELCDVHITSVTHAESHYAGKPHRAIVEGRKKPKNPFLLQSGMEGRIQQLLRREKKHAPVVEKPAAEVLAPSASAKTDLYCDICKTSVTCTEQMTMHLNGKKHLSKEKQHIIRVMNSQKEAADDNGTAGTDTSEKAAPKTEGQAAGGGDWGNGSGTWE